MIRSVTVTPDWRRRLATAGLADLAALLRQSPAASAWPGRWQVLTKPGLGGRERWRWQLPDGGLLYVKRYRHPPWNEQLDRIRRQAAAHSRAWWEFHQSAELARNYIPAVRAVAAVEQMRGGVELCSAVLLEPAGGEALDRLWTRLAAQHARLTRGLARHDLTRRLARFVSAFHQTGLCHRDLYLCHIFAELDQSGQQPPRFMLIDLARTFRPRLRRLRWVIKDLAQLDTSARQLGLSYTDRLRFLLAYLGLERGAPRARWYARRIVRKSNRILQRIARRQPATTPDAGHPVGRTP